MTELAARRRFFAEEIEVCTNVQTPALVEALASVPREAYVPPGPWLIRGEGDVVGGPRQTPDADPKHLYHNVSVAIDPARQLFNGAPGAVIPALDALTLDAGARVLHVGCGFGYYTALIAHIVGTSGRVLAIEVDDALAAEARSRLEAHPQVEVQHGDGRTPLSERFDAILINAGVTHPEDAWLDAAPDGSRIVLPLTATMPQMGPVGKGFMLLLTATADGSFDVRQLNLVAVYSAIGLRDDAMNAALGKAMMRGPFLPRGMRLRRDSHEPAASCWLHGPTCCFVT